MRRPSTPESPPSDTHDDVIDEAIRTFRANVLFRNFEVRGGADRVLIYLSLFIHQVLKKAEKIPTKAEALKQIMPLASGSHVMPGEPSWPLGTLLPSAKSASELGMCLLRGPGLHGMARTLCFDLAPLNTNALAHERRNAARIFQAAPGGPPRAPRRAHLQRGRKRQQALAPLCKAQVPRKGVRLVGESVSRCWCHSSSSAEPPANPARAGRRRETESERLSLQVIVVLWAQ